MGKETAILSSHLTGIDPERWPHVVTIPHGTFIQLSARRAEAGFARAMQRAKLTIEPVALADIVVEHEALFYRIAESGWLGFAESYMAGEWRARDLVTVLTALLDIGYVPGAPLKPRRHSFGDYDGGELPPELVALSSVDGVSLFGGIFAAAATTARRPIDVGKRRRYIDVTRFESPEVVERADLESAQERAVDLLLDGAGVGRSTYLLEMPASGGLLASRAVQRGATVDTLTPDVKMADAMKEYLTLEGVDNSVHSAVTEGLLPAEKTYRERYEALVSVEKLDKIAPAARTRFFDAIDRFLVPGGRLAVQTLVATGAMTAAREKASDVIRAYLWPTLNYPTIDDVRSQVTATRRLKHLGERYFGDHYEHTLRLQRELFLARQADAAAIGFDPVFRRLWDFHLALLEAYLRVGAVDAVQVMAIAR